MNTKIIRNKQNYEKVSEVNRNNAKRRWDKAKKVSNRMRSHPKAYDNDNDSYASGTFNKNSSKKEVWVKYSTLPLQDSGIVDKT